jgi:hypothetical protein
MKIELSRRHSGIEDTHETAQYINLTLGAYNIFHQEN